MECPRCNNDMQWKITPFFGSWRGYWHCDKCWFNTKDCNYTTYDYQINNSFVIKGENK